MVELINITLSEKNGLRTYMPVTYKCLCRIEKQGILLKKKKGVFDFIKPFPIFIYFVKPQMNKYKTELHFSNNEVKFGGGGVNLFGLKSIRYDHVSMDMFFKFSTKEFELKFIEVLNCRGEHTP